MNTPKTRHYPCCFTLESNPGPFAGIFCATGNFLFHFMASFWNIFNQPIDCQLGGGVALNPLKPIIRANFVPKAGKRNKTWGSESKKRGMGTVYTAIAKLSNWLIVEINTFAP